MSSKLDYIYDCPIFVDLYELLDVEIDSRPEEIKKAYLKLSKIHHPDHGGNNEMFQEITKAYEILYSKDTRKEYDIYFLKKNMDKSEIDDLLRFKNEYKNFVNANTKPISEDKLSELYKTLFDNNIKEEVLEDNELTKRINDINLERETMDIEVDDDRLYKLTSDDNTVNDVFEFIKNKKDEMEHNSSNNTIITNNGIQRISDARDTACLSSAQALLNHGVSSLDTLPITNINYHSLNDDDLESTLYSSINTPENNLLYNPEDININDINEWKKTKTSDKKLSNKDIDDYLDRRKKEENDIFSNVASELNIKKTSKFLQNTYVSEDIQINDKSIINNIRKREPDT
jgi:curved DNA-binding protein CbpA